MIPSRFSEVSSFERDLVQKEQYNLNKKLIPLGLHYVDNMSVSIWHATGSATSVCVYEENTYTKKAHIIHTFSQREYGYLDQNS